METLIAILLYLHLLISPGTYTIEHINNLEMIHQVEINNVQQDPVRMDEVNKIYLPQVEHVIVINEHDTDA